MNTKKGWVSLTKGNSELEKIPALKYLNLDRFLHKLIFAARCAYLKSYKINRD